MVKQTMMLKAYLFRCIATVFLGASILAAAGFALADEPVRGFNESGGADSPSAASAPHTLDEMVVSASKVEEAVITIPKHVTVISGDNIRAAAGRNIIDILGREAGIHVRGSTGTDKHAILDLRGMGDTAASNVIVMVDGMSINAPDMSGPSITTVPLERIERIEIVRGAGSVVYGSGAVGGVVNIITRKPGEDPAASVYASYGSYGTLNSRVSGDGRAGSLGFSLSAGMYDSDGYRDNGFLEKKDFDANAVYAFTDTFSLLLSGTYYADEYGLPGPVGRNDMDSRSRRVLTRFPEDFGETTDIRGIAGFEADLDEWGALTFKRGYTIRDSAYLMGYSPAISKSVQMTDVEEDTRKSDINYVKDYRLFGRFHRVQVGMDHAITEYVRENAYSGLRKNSQTKALGFFINNQWEVTESLLVNAGSRYNTYRGRFRTDEKQTFQNNVQQWVNGGPELRRWRNTAWALGATFLINPAASVFASYNTSFRIPNVDEFAESEPGLKPQEGRHVEIGGRHQIGALGVLAVSLFDIRIDDEIYYSDINRNYDDKTVRQGVEADIKLYPRHYLTLWGTYTYTRATFDDAGTTVPLVPAHMASAGLQWLPAEKIRLSLSGTYTGSSYDGNDTDNKTYKRISDYTVFDASASYDQEHITVFAGVNNVFDTLYAGSAYSEQYYPMPGRNFFGGFRWTW